MAEEPPEDAPRRNPGYDVASVLLGVLGGRSAQREFDRTMQAMAGEGTPEENVGKATAAAAGGLALGAAVAEKRKRVREQADRTGEPVIDVREIENELGEPAGVRIFCSELDATVFRGDDAVLLRTPNGEEVPIQVGFTPGILEDQSAEAILDVIVRPDGYEPPAARKNEDDGEDESEANADVPDGAPAVVSLDDDGDDSDDGAADGQADSEERSEGDGGGESSAEAAVKDPEDDQDDGEEDEDD